MTKRQLKASKPRRQRIGYSVCSVCGSLRNVTIPDSVTSIGEAAFVYCPKLNDVYYFGTEEQNISIAADYKLK